MPSLHSHLSHPKYRADIDGLRALAVLSVVVFHAFPSWLQGGFIGVDIFFVISGYLISTIIFQNLNQNTFSFKEFYARRIRRIFPALILVLSASYIFGWFALFADEYKQLGKHMAAGAGFIANFIFWFEVSYFDNSADTKPLLHLWSLGIEEQFYIVWPFLLWVAWKRKLNLFIVSSILAAASFYWNVQGVRLDTTASFYSPQTRFWELLCGSVLAWVAVYKHDAWVALQTKLLAHWLSWIGLLLLVFGFWYIHKGLSFPGVWAVVPVMGAGLIIAAGSGAWINQHILSNKLAVVFGLISFPLYLWHWPLLSFARIIESETPSRGIRICAVALSIVLAWLTYRWIERPLRSGLQNKAKVTVLVVLMMIIAFLGYNTYSREGYEFRSAVKNFNRNKNGRKELEAIAEKDAGCLAYTGLSSSLFPYCRFSHAGSLETVAVIGDSHAAVAFLGISEYLKTRGMNTVLLANNACPPFLGVEGMEYESERAACKLRIEQLINTVLSRKDIKKIFFFTRGPIYLTRTEPVTGQKDLSHGFKLSSADFLMAAQKTIQGLVDSGKTVYYVTENPELSFPVESCIARPFRSISGQCYLEKTSVLNRQADYLAMMGQLKNVEVINSLSTFCPQESCLIFENGKLLYADDDHLSLAGSRFQVKKLLANHLQ
jgi:peptidoglycan/LPS O-acetylase OafA/YrhL